MRGCTSSDPLPARMHQVVWFAGTGRRPIMPPELSYADIVQRDLPLSPSEAASLVLAASDALEALGEPNCELPELELIRVSRSGEVSLGAVGREAEERERVQRAAALLRRLLRLDRDGPRGTRVPGGLLLLIARATGAIDATPPSPAEWTCGLNQLGSAHPATLARLYDRWLIAPATRGSDEATDGCRRPAASSRGVRVACASDGRPRATHENIRRGGSRRPRRGMGGRPDSGGPRRRGDESGSHASGGLQS